MRVAILAGGRGRRLEAGGEGRPKPLVPIGSDPILWHVLRGFAEQGYVHSLIALGHRASEIAARLLDRAGSDRATLDHPIAIAVPEWQGTMRLVETGVDTDTGGRVRRLLPLLGRQRFVLAWCDGLSDVAVRQLVDFHAGSGCLVTVLAVRPPSRFGHLTISGDKVTEFVEKPSRVDVWINGGIFVVEPEIARYLDGDSTSWDRDVLPRLAADGVLAAYRHHGFWRCMDDAHDREFLDRLWTAGNIPWLMRQAA
jgi:glucose-1-phosphate cytidylyltransferase